MIQINQETIDFLTEIRSNNNREWFNLNKKKYEKAKNNFESFAAYLLENLQNIDESLRSTDLKQCVYRIYRDVRFSPNKEPYKTHFGVYMAKNGGRKSPFAGYYFHLDADQSFFGGGIYMPIPEYLKTIRKEIFYQIDEFKNIISKPDFTKYYSGIDPFEKLKKAPADFPKDFPDIELLKNKHFFSSHYFKNEDVAKKEFVQFAIDGFHAVKPLIEFLNFSVEN